MRPLRREKNCHVTRDPITGIERILGLIEEQDALSNGGSVDSIRFRHKFFQDCGCDAEIGGRCFECGAISCKSCHGRCQKCQKPICMQHSNFLQTANNEVKIRLCDRCYDIVIRKEKFARVARFFLSPFIQMDK